MLDVLDIAAAEQAIAAAEPFDILVNNAGTNRPKPFTEVTHDDYDAVMDLNLRAAFFVAQAVAQATDRGAAARLDHQHLIPDGPCRRRRTGPSTARPNGAWRG